jgi:hypothetical protein
MDLNWIGFYLDFVMEWRFLGLEETNQKWIKINKKENTIKRKKVNMARKMKMMIMQRKWFLTFISKVDFLLTFF